MLQCKQLYRLKSYGNDKTEERYIKCEKEKIINKYFKTKSKRISKFLYSLGFDKISKYDNGIEFWLYQKSDALEKALDFYFSFRKENYKKAGDNVYEKKDIFELQKDRNFM